MLNTLLISFFCGDLKSMQVAFSLYALYSCQVFPWYIECLPISLWCFKNAPAYFKWHLNETLTVLFVRSGILVVYIFFLYLLDKFTSVNLLEWLISALLHILALGWRLSSLLWWKKGGGIALSGATQLQSDETLDILKVWHFYFLIK